MVERVTGKYNFQDVQKIELTFTQIHEEQANNLLCHLLSKQYVPYRNK